MRLLVSVANSTEAIAALRGGADLVDAKDPTRGALGAVSRDELREICVVVSDARPVTAALGDAHDEQVIEGIAFEYADAGTSFVKVGFAGITNVTRATHLTAAAVRGAANARSGTCGVVAVAYADADGADSVAPRAVIEVASHAGAAGVLLDTADKSGPGLFGLLSPDALRDWVAAAHEAGLLAALAGKLTAGDLPLARDAGADIAGVRGAACERGRSSRVVADKVRLLQAAILSLPERLTRHRLRAY